MEINIKPNISFQSLKIINSDGLKLFKGFKCRDRNSQLYNVNINKVAELRYEISAKPLNTHTPVSAADRRFNEDSINLDLISTNISKQKQGLGTILNLANIIEMLENKNIKMIKGYSMSTAIPFHAKNGFSTNGIWDGSLCSNIEKIASLKSPKWLAQKAKLLLYRQQELSWEEKTTLGNSIMNDYLKLSIKNKQDLTGEFSNGIDMFLEQKTVIENKDYYNKLFKKYNIDYEI